MEKQKIEEKITEYLTTNKRLPTGKEAGILLDLPGTTAAAHVTQYAKNLTRMLVLPDGKVYTYDGELCWKQHTSGSLVPACHRYDKHLGHVIYG